MKNLILLLCLCAAVSAQQVNQDIIPGSTGLNLGHSNQRWNIFGQALNINGTLTVSSTGTLTFSGATTISGTGTFKLANAGVFTNTQMNQYVTSLINGIPFDLYHSVQGFPGYTTEGGTFGVAVPIAAPIGEGDGLVGMVTSACNSSGRTTCNAVAISGHAEALASNAAVWGQNTTVSNHNAALTGVNLIGNEVDIGVAGNQSAGYVHGLDIFLTPAVGATMPTGGFQAVGLEIGKSTNTAQWAQGLYIPGTAISGDAILISSSCSTGPCSSATISQYGLDGSSVAHTGKWSVDSNGNIVLSVDATGLGVKPPQSSFANLGSSAANGVLVYCTDCKNVADNGVTAGAACVSGGNGTLARRDNNRWDCN